MEVHITEVAQQRAPQSATDCGTHPEGSQGVEGNCMLVIEESKDPKEQLTETKNATYFGVHQLKETALEVMKFILGMLFQTVSSHINIAEQQLVLYGMELDSTNRDDEP